MSNNIIPLKNLLIEKIEAYFGVKTFEHFNEEKFKTDFILRNERNNIPLGLFIICENVPQVAKIGWKLAQKELLGAPVYFINSKRWFKTGELELVKVSNLITFDNKNQCFENIVIVSEPVSDNNIERASTATELESLSTPPVFNLKLSKWGEKVGKVRYYVNGDVKSIFLHPGSVSGSEKVFFEKDEVKVFPYKPLKPEAIDYIKLLVKQLENNSGNS